MLVLYSRRCDTYALPWDVFSILYQEYIVLSEKKKKTRLLYSVLKQNGDLHVSFPMTACGSLGSKINIPIPGRYVKDSLKTSRSKSYTNTH